MKLFLLSLVGAMLTLPGSQAVAAAADSTNLSTPGANVILRGRLESSRRQFEHAKKGRVAFLGGSITEMEGYRPIVCDVLKERFPETDFSFINAGISSTCSTTGAFRFQRDVLDHGPVDLLFVEFAVNDDQDGHFSRQECIRGMEGVVRHALVANPRMDIVMTYFVNESMLKTLQSGGIPLTIEAHGAVAEHYGVSTINLAKETAEEITAGKLTWTQYGGVHPATRGNRLAANMIAELFRQAWGEPEAGAAPDTVDLPPPLDPFSYFHGRFIEPTEANLERGWRMSIPSWDLLPGGKRSRFTSVPIFSNQDTGAETKLEFTGSSIGAYILAGPDAGVAEVSVDGGPAHTVDLYHEFSAELHYPRTVIFADDLRRGKHTLRLRAAPAPAKGGGHALRIMEFTAD